MFRAYALQRHRPLTLRATIRMPTVNEIPSERVEISGFIHLVNVYRPFDEVFVGLWNKERTDCSTSWLAQLQAKLEASLPADLDCTESQAADLCTSQHWLRTMVWRLSNNYLSSNAADHSMTFEFPVTVVRDLLTLTASMSKQSMEVHGIGLVGDLAPNKAFC